MITSIALPGTNHERCQATMSSRRIEDSDCSLLTQPRTWSLPHKRFSACADASVPGSSSRCCALAISASRSFASSASGNVGWVTMSLSSSKHVPALRDITLHDSIVASNVESAAMVPPTVSIALASAVASRLRVPLTSMSAASSATPRRARGSCIRPARTASCIATSGSRLFLTT